MNGIQKLLLRKIVITGVLLCLPLLTFPPSWFVALGVPVPEPLLLARLLGAAYLALLVGYYMGLRGIGRGGSAVPVVAMGIASNGLAGGMLLYFGLSGSGESWGTGARIYLWLIAVGALWITLQLLRYAAARRYDKPAELTPASSARPARHAATPTPPDCALLPLPDTAPDRPAR